MVQDDPAFTRLLSPGIKSMTSISRSESLRLLRGYLGHIEYWDPECGDAFLMLNAREWLENHLADLTASEKEALAAGDERLLKLSRDTADATLDVEYLRETAKVVAVSRLPSRIAALGQRCHCGGATLPPWTGWRKPRLLTSLRPAEALTLVAALAKQS